LGLFRTVCQPLGSILGLNKPFGTVLDFLLAAAIHYGS
jgi:hypothetical protein